MKKKVLVFYGSYGSGHKTIGEAIASYFKENSDKYDVEIIDVVNYGNYLGKFTAGIFNLVIKYRTELIFDLSYELSDNKLGSIWYWPIVRNSFVNKKMEKELVRINPDIVISTHFFCSDVIAYYNKKKKINSKLITISTDYVSHSFWRKSKKHNNAYVVANDVVKNEMIEKGVDGKKIHVFGLPIDQKRFMNLASKEEIIKKYDLDVNKKTYVFFGGGSAGSMSYFKYFKALVQKEYPINLVFICGKNKKMEEKALKFVSKYNLKNVKVVGFITDVYSLLQVTDYVISKPGGATVTECMMMRVPLIAIPGFGGQEKYNARFVVKKKIGLKIRGGRGLARIVKKTITNDKLYLKFKQNLEKEEQNESTKKIFELSEKLLREGKK